MTGTTNFVMLFHCIIKSIRMSAARQVCVGLAMALQQMHLLSTSRRLCMLDLRAKESNIESLSRNFDDLIEERNTLEAKLAESRDKATTREIGLQRLKSANYTMEESMAAKDRQIESLKFEIQNLQSERKDQMVRCNSRHSHCL